MGDMGDYWRDVKAALKPERDTKRRSREQSVPETLARLGVSFEVKNDGHHLIIRMADGRVVDFWPAGGRWIGRNAIGDGYGFKPLMKFLGVNL